MRSVGYNPKYNRKTTAVVFFLCLGIVGFACSRKNKPTAISVYNRPFVQRVGTCLYAGGQALKLTGSSAFYLQEESAREALAIPGSEGILERTLNNAERYSLRVLRIAGFNDGPRDEVAIQRTPGVLSPHGIHGLDRVVAAASQRDLWLIIVLSNYWDDYGGITQYLRWASLPTNKRALAFTDPSVRNALKQYFRAVIEHVNPLTHRSYRDEPSILAWEIMNEPRGTDLSDDGKIYTEFLTDLAQEIHNIDPHHLVMVGDEGLDANTTNYNERFWQNVSQENLIHRQRHESFQALVQHPAIDIATIHYYPDAWGVAPEYTDQAAKLWITEHANIARRFDKPIIVEEIGIRSSTITNQQPTMVYDRWFAHALHHPNLVGWMPWGLWHRNGSAPDGYTFDGNESVFWQWREAFEQSNHECQPPK